MLYKDMSLFGTFEAFPIGLECNRTSAPVEPSLPSRMVKQTDLTHGSNFVRQSLPITPDSSGEAFPVEVLVA